MKPLSTAERETLTAELETAKAEQARCMGGVDPAGCVAAARRVTELRVKLVDDVAMAAHLQACIKERGGKPTMKTKNITDASTTATEATMESPQAASAPAAAKATSKATAKKKAAKTAAPAKATKKAAKPAPKAKAARKTAAAAKVSKNDMIRDMIVRKGGATYNQILKATGWKRASGTVSVIGKSIKGFTSYKNAKGERAFKAA
jgi:hypothetical protein